MKKTDVLEFFKVIRREKKVREEFLNLLTEALDLRKNKYHPLAFINGNPKIGRNVFIGAFSVINAKKSAIKIGDNCDIACFVAINAADSHKRCLGFTGEIERRPVTLERNIFVGSHSFIHGKTHIGHHSVVGAGTVLINAGRIPPYSLVIGNPARIKPGYFLRAPKNES